MTLSHTERSRSAMTHLQLDDIEQLQDLFRRCTDYYELEEGESTVADAAEYLLLNKPSSLAPEDKIVLGLYSETGLLVAICDLLRNYPSAGEWWIGLLMIDPEYRSAGLGTQLLQEVFSVANAEQATALWVAPLVQNPNAQRFWERHGFVEQRTTRHYKKRTHEYGGGEKENDAMTVMTVMTV